MAPKSLQRSTFILLLFFGLLSQPNKWHLYYRSEACLCDTANTKIGPYFLDELYLKSPCVTKSVCNGRAVTAALCVTAHMASVNADTLACAVTSLTGQLSCQEVCFFVCFFLDLAAGQHVSNRRCFPLSQWSIYTQFPESWRNLNEMLNKRGWTQFQPQGWACVCVLYVLMSGVWQM